MTCGPLVFVVVYTYVPNRPWALIDVLLYFILILYSCFFKFRV